MHSVAATFEAICRWGNLRKKKGKTQHKEGNTNDKQQWATKKQELSTLERQVKNTNNKKRKHIPYECIYESDPTLRITRSSPNPKAGDTAGLQHQPLRRWDQRQGWWHEQSPALGGWIWGSTWPLAFDTVQYETVSPKRYDSALLQ